MLALNDRTPRAAALSRFGMPTLCASAILLTAANAHAFQFKFEDPQMKGFLDTSTTLNATWRTQKADARRVSYGNQNFSEGDLVSTPLKITPELGLSYGSMGLFTRANYVYDAKIEGNERISDAAEDVVSNKFRLLDAFVYDSFEFSNAKLTTRLGSQVVNWGESTFIGNGINSTNPIDATKARGAGVEVKEVNLPLPMLWASMDFGGAFSIEAYYNSEWNETILDPVGTFFSTSDAVGEGPNRLRISSALSLPRRNDMLPDDGGAYGVALRTVIEPLNSADVGIYHLRYHSFAPYVQVTRPGASPLSAYYQLLYPEDIDLYGLSINADLPGDLGISIGGELSFRPDAPLARDSAVVIGRSLAGAAAVPPIAPYDEGNLTQAQFTLTYQVGSQNPFAADKMTLVFEPGVALANLPDKTYYSNYDSVSWGYAFRGALEYADAFLNMTVTPTLAFRHDVAGTTPGAPSGTFLNDRKSATLSAQAVYLDYLTFELGYTRNWGAEFRSASALINTAADRDFLALSAKYNF